MMSKKVTLSIPEYLYEESLKITEVGLFSNFSDLVRAGIRRELKDVSRLFEKKKPWAESIKEIQMRIEKAGGIKGSNEEIIKRIKRTRKELWKEEYQKEYSNRFGQ